MLAYIRVFWLVNGYCNGLDPDEVFQRAQLNFRDFFTLVGFIEHEAFLLDWYFDL